MNGTFFLCNAANRPDQQIWVSAEANRAVCSFHPTSCTEDPHLTAQDETGTSSYQEGRETEFAFSWRVSIYPYRTVSFPPFRKFSPIVIYNAVSFIFLKATATVARNKKRMKSFLTRAQRPQMCALALTSLPPVSKDLFLWGLKAHTEHEQITNIYVIYVADPDTANKGSTEAHCLCT